MSINDASPADWDRVAKVARQSTMDKQVGGSHYTDQGIQPLEVTYENFGYYGVRAALYTKVNKYLSRNKGNHVQDLELSLIHISEPTNQRGSRMPSSA